MKPVEGSFRIRTTCAYCGDIIEVISTNLWAGQLFDCIDGKSACSECVKKHVEKEREEDANNVEV
jgi:hypothetical protein